MFNRILPLPPLVIPFAHLPLQPIYIAIGALENWDCRVLSSKDGITANRAMKKLTKNEKLIQ
jgi:hypothetical protein